MSPHAEESVPNVANADMAAAWDGAEGDHWTERAEHYERTTAPHRERLLASDLVAEADSVLDVGCGTGALTRAAAVRAPQGSALGVDLSSRMLDRARELTAAEGIANATYDRADAEVHPFVPGSVDVVVSSFGAMFFGDPARAFANLHRALAPAGRVALLAWRDLDRNPWIATIRTALAAGRDLPRPPSGAPGPFGLADPTRVSDLLTGADFHDVELTEVREPMVFGRDLDDAFDFISGMGFARGLLSDLEPSARGAALESLRGALDAARSPAGVGFDSSAWLVTARRG